MKEALPGKPARTAPRPAGSGSRSVACLLALLGISGCASSADSLPLEIRRGQPVIEKILPEAKRLRVAVIPFEDQRSDTGRIGTRIDWLSAERPLTVGPYLLGETLAEIFVDYLKRRHGWHAWIAKPGVIPPDAGPDITLSGTITVFNVEAVAAFGGRNLTVALQLSVTSRRPIDQQFVVVTLADTATQRVFWFENQDLELFVSATIRTLLDAYILQLEADDLRPTVK